MTPSARGGGATPVIVLMGVAGSGKSTIGEALSARLGWPFRDADSFHPPSNVAKMSRGEPLTDDDRKPWLAAIADWIDMRQRAGASAIVSCSALKRAYRDVIVGSRPGVTLVHLAGTPALIGSRMAARRNHFMPTSLLDSQFATLEPPAAHEALIVDVDAPPEAIAQRIIASIGEIAP
jgi:carbohydrate kinase (thermoresistant glucokinase family)